ncbi:MAG: hypothetical protein EZS28_044704, partial [Streblomastix strix]
GSQMNKSKGSKGSLTDMIATGYGKSVGFVTGLFKRSPKEDE